MTIKPQLAEDAILEQVQFPCIVQPKIDGVRALNLNGTLTGRSLDPFKGFGITEYFSHPDFIGLDGEMTLGDKPNCGNRLCSMTTGAMGRFKGVTEMPDLHWWVFDYVNDTTVNMSYAARYLLLRARVIALGHPRIHLVPRHEVENADQLNALIDQHSKAGFEGTIIRNPTSVYKPGRSTLEGQLWRVKPWGDFEILVTGITEGQVNTNEAKTNTLGRTERSSAKDGMVPNGQVGSIQGTLVNDLVVNGGDKVIKAGTPITAGSGKMTEDEAAFYFQNPDQIVGHFAKVKTMLHGVKDLPRFPTFESIRLKEDMSKKVDLFA